MVYDFIVTGLHLIEGMVLTHSLKLKIFSRVYIPKEVRTLIVRSWYFTLHCYLVLKRVTEKVKMVIKNEVWCHIIY